MNGQHSRVAGWMIAAAAIWFAATCRAAGPTTHPAVPTSQPTTQDDESPELKEAMESLMPVDVRQGRRQPTEREKMASWWAMMLALGQKSQFDEQQHEKNAKARTEFDERWKQTWADHAKASPQVRQELAIVEKLSREQLHSMDFIFNQPTTFPSTQASEKDLVARIKMINPTLDRAEVVDRDVKYHAKRLEILEEIDELSSRDNTAIIHQKLTAERELLNAVDAEYAAQVKADAIHTPLPTTQPTTRPAQ